MIDIGPSDIDMILMLITYFIITVINVVLMCKYLKDEKKYKIVFLFQMIILMLIVIGYIILENNIMINLPDIIWWNIFFGVIIYSFVQLLFLILSIIIGLIIRKRKKNKNG